MARILITGGAGDVGSHAAKALAAAWREGAVFDNLSTGHREFVRGLARGRHRKRKLIVS